MNTLLFSHQPLARDRPSIRLFQVSPDLTPDGLIQCTISHDIITESLTYTCLSYAWGAPEPARIILINGERFSVRQNLHDFLSLTQRKISTENAESTTYWIDALCIDQRNVLEKNHQVQQMGKIYSSAICVHIWLGPMPRLKAVVPILRNPGSASTADRDMVNGLGDYITAKITENGYWTRAWITQEVLLARQPLVILDTELLPLSTLIWGMQHFRISMLGALLHSGLIINTPQSRWILTSVSYFNSWNLVALAARFHQRKCSISRDHFYSLLSLCEASSELTVDYESSACELAYHILLYGMKSPCWCSTLFIIQMLGVEDEVQKGAHKSSETGHFIQFECTRLVVGYINQVGQHRSQLGSTEKNSVVVEWAQHKCMGGPSRMARRKRLVSCNTPAVLRRWGAKDLNSLRPGSGPHHEVHNTLVEGSLEYWTEYVRTDGFSARYNEKCNTYTVRIALWALATWKNFDWFKGNILCAIANPVELKRRSSDDVCNDLEVRIGIGPWDLEADESDNAKVLSLGASTATA